MAEQKANKTPRRRLSWPTFRARCSSSSGASPIRLPRRLADRGALAGRLRLSRPAAASRGGRWRPRPGTFECAACQRQTSVTAGTVLARLEAAADRVVLGGLPDGDPFQRHPALQLQKQLGLGSYKNRLAAVRQAAPRHGRARPPAARRPGRGRRDHDSLPLRRRSAHRRRRAQPSGQDAGRRRGRGPGRRAGPHPADRHRGLCRQDPARRDPRHHRPRRHRQDRWLGPATQALPTSTTSPTSSARWPPTSSCPGPIACSRTSRPGRWASTMACAASTSRPTSTS